jgi:TonB family protein
MAYRTGRCLNDLYCASASAKQNVQIPVGSAFVCPQCGKGLSEPPLEKRGFMGPALMACGGLVVAGGALFVVGAMIGKGKPADAMVVQNVPAPRAEMPPAEASKPPASSVAVAVPAPPVATAPAPQSARAAPAAPVASAPAVKLAMVQTAPSPAALQAKAQAEHAAAAQALAAQQAQARADAARQARAADLAKRAEAAQAAVEKQKLAVAQAQDAKRKAQYLKQEAEQEARARQAADTARVAQAQAQAQAQAKAAADAQAARTREAALAQTRVAAAAPAVKGPTRGFSANAISGGAPSYPSAYEDGRVGRVTVSCLISQSGSPSGCHVVSSQGGVGFSNAALGWLRSGQVRFAPILRDGEARSEEHSWTMSFEP